MAVLLVGGYRVSDGSLELGVLTSFLLYLRQFYDPMQDVGIFYNSLQSATAALEKIALVLAEHPACQSRPPRRRSASRCAADHAREVSSATGAGPAVLPELTWPCRPGRRSRWSARPGPARPRSPS